METNNNTVDKSVKKLTPLITDNERKNIRNAMAVNCPFDAGIGRIILIQVKRDYVEEKVEGTNMLAIEHNGIWLPSQAVNKTGDIGRTEDLAKGVIKAIGPLKDMNGKIVRDASPYMVNQIVYIFPHVFETMVSVDGIDYFFYSERDIVATMRNMKEVMDESGL